MYLSKLVGHFIFSNYTHAVHEKMSSDKLISRKLIPKKIVNWGRSLHDRKITVRYSSSSTEVTKKLVTENKKKINKFFSLDMRDYINNTYECELVTDHFLERIHTIDKVNLKKNVIRCAHFIAAYPHYTTMTSEELNKAFLSTPHIPKKILQESDLREATNFALRDFMNNASTRIFRYQDGRKYNENMDLTTLIEQQKKSTVKRPTKIDKHQKVDSSHYMTYNRVVVTEDNGNKHLKKVKFDNNSPTSSHYSFDLLDAEKRKKLLENMSLLLSDSKK